jgi:hypothetical protein
VTANLYANDSIWEDLDGDIELFVAIEELLKLLATHQARLGSVCSLTRYLAELNTGFFEHNLKRMFQGIPEKWGQ